MTLGEGMFRGLSTDDRHDKKMHCFHVKSFMNGDRLLFPKTRLCLLFMNHGKNGETGFWANLSPISQPKRPLERP